MKAFSRFTSEDYAGVIIWAFILLCPFFLSLYAVTNFVYYLAMGVLALSVVLIWGFCGIFSFGQSAFFGGAAYIYSIVALNLEGNGLSTLIASLVALAVVAVFAMLIGAMMFYGGVNDVFVGLITMCVTLAFNTFMGQTAGSQWHVGSVPLGGFNGISNVPSIGLGGGVSDPVIIFYMTAVAACILFWVVKRFPHVKIGRIAVSIRENRDRSALLGYDVPLYQTVVFTLGAVIAGLSGIMFVNWGNYVTPGVFDLTTASIPVVLVAAAGRQNVSGSLLFSIIYYWINSTLSASGSQYAQIILGVILILCVLFVPKGLMTWIFAKTDELLQRSSANTKSPVRAAVAKEAKA